MSTELIKIIGFRNVLQCLKKKEALKAFNSKNNVSQELSYYFVTVDDTECPAGLLSNHFHRKHLQGILGETEVHGGGGGLVGRD